MTTSNDNQPVMTSASSPDTLPLHGYSCDQLANYILRQLGSPTWTIELTKQQVLDCIQDALGMYSQWVPNTKVGSIPMTRGVSRYLEGVNVGLGIVKVDFVEKNLSTNYVVDLFYGNLTNTGVLFRTGMDEYDSFLRWRKTWMRVMSVQPDWYYDDMERCLYIHNPIERYQCGIYCYWPFERTEGLNYQGADWVKRYSVAKARYQLGDLWMKYSGAIPGPVKDIQLDASKRDKAQEEMTTLEANLKAMGKMATPLID